MPEGKVPHNLFEHFPNEDKVFMVQTKMIRRAGVSRRVIFRGQGEVRAKLKLDTDVRLAPFNLDFLQISSYEFSWEYGRSRVKYLRKVLPEGDIPQHLF